jgi:putative pyruvate formate lyase activating enzyme
MNSDDTYPSYLALYHSGDLVRRADEAWKRMEDCQLCPRRCHKNRLAGEKGTCRTTDKAWLSSFHPHYGEEAPLVGNYGSGTLFFAHCNLLCNFCQNYDISHYDNGVPVTPEELAAAMISLQERGCHNINLVSPTHVMPQILKSLVHAAGMGLNIPIVYNSGGYDLPESLHLLEGVIDIYMPDFKFWDPEMANITCAAADYPSVARAALKEMYRQVGDLVINKEGIAVSGLLVRHLVLPEGWAGTAKVMEFIAKEISADTYVNVMSQFRPCAKSRYIKALSRELTLAEYRQAVKQTLSTGIHRLDKGEII